MRDVTSSGIWTIVVAAGSGVRFGAPKQFLDLEGERVVDRSVATAARHSAGVVVVVPGHPVPGNGDAALPPIAGVELRVVEGAETRAGSVRRGLACVPADASVVVVHDAARPLASDALYERVIAAVVDGADAATPVVGLTDTIRRRSGGVEDRADLVAVQTPQAFRATTLRAAHAGEADATDDVTLVEAAGGKVVLVDGDRRNLKLTTPLDMDVARLFLDRDGHR